MAVTRRALLAGPASFADATMFGAPSVVGQAKPRVVVIGGGAGGATAANYVAKDRAGAISLTLAEPLAKYQTRFHSNLSLGGFRDYGSITGADAALRKKYGIVVAAERANKIDRDSGLANASGFCAIDPASMKSLADNNIYVLGDASIAGHMPKSAFSANSQAKVAAMMVRGELTWSRTFDARYTNTCWSLIETDDCVKVGGAYEPKVARLPRPRPLSRRRVSRRRCASTSRPRTWAGITASPPTFSAEGFRSKVNRRG